MENSERGELSRNIRNISNSIPRKYVERGVSRSDLPGRKTREREDEFQPKDMSEFRALRLREEAQRKEEQRKREREAAERAGDSQGRFRRKGAIYGVDSENPPHTEQATRRFHTHAVRPGKDAPAEEEPPLLDTLREAAGRKKQARREFEERYEHSRSGASHIERERFKGKNGAVIRDVEYYVPKLEGQNSDLTPVRKKKKRNRKPMKMWQKASVTALCLFMVFLFSIGMGVSALLNRMNFVDQQQAAGASRGSGSSFNAQAEAEAAAEMDGVDDGEIELPDTPIMFDADIENVLLIGSDRRSKSEDGRSDAMMMLTIDRKHKKIKMISYLRDMYIKVPGKHYGTKLNTTYSLGGVNLLKQALQVNLGITVDKYIIIDFNAFKTVVNKIGKLNGKGGIKITVTSAEARYMCSHEVYGLFPRYSKGKGTYYMTGAEALNYARIRKIDSDFGRTKRQRKVLTEIMTELKGVSKMDLLNIAYACLEYVTTDFTKGELVGLVTEAAEIVNYETKQISIPIKGSYSTSHLPNGSEVLAANLSVNSKELIKFIYDDDMTYENNEKEMHGVYLPDLKGIANSKDATTRAQTDSTTAAGDTSGTTKAATAKTTSKKAG